MNWEKRKDGTSGRQIYGLNKLKRKRDPKKKKEGLYCGKIRIQIRSDQNRKEQEKGGPSNSVGHV